MTPDHSFSLTLRGDRTPGQGAAGGGTTEAGLRSGLAAGAPLEAAHACSFWPVARHKGGESS